MFVWFVFCLDVDFELLVSVNPVIVQILLGYAHRALVVDVSEHFEGSLLVFAIDGQPLAIPLEVCELCHSGVVALALYAVTLKADRLVGWKLSTTTSTTIKYYINKLPLWV